MPLRKLDSYLFFLMVSSLLWHVLAFVPSTQAQVTTSITSDNSLGTTVNQVGNVYNIENGRITGSNQFHSFGEFSVGTGDIASFNGPAGIANILSRVTGGKVSNIYGTIQSTIEGANLFLMNPAGVIFGPSASLNVSGSFHTTTADFLKLGEDGMFFASLGEESVFTMAPVEAFGFLNANPAAIEVDRSSLNMPNGESFSLIGGDITLMGKPGSMEQSVQTLEGQITLVSVDSPGEVAFSGRGEPMLKSFSSLGDIHMSEEAFFTLEDFGSTSGGTVMIRGGQFVMENGDIFNQTWGEQSGGPVSIVASKEVFIGGGSSIQTTTWADGDGGLIEIQAPQVTLTDNTVLQAGTAGTGTGGAINISGDTVNLSGEAFHCESVRRSCKCRTRYYNC